MKDQRIKKIDFKIETGKQISDVKNICKNTKCKLRKAGCKGFEGCPGFMAA